MISGTQIKAARSLLRWSQQDLADRALVSVSSVRRMESGGLDSEMNASTVECVRRALEDAGVQFFYEDGSGGEGVRMRPRLSKRPGHIR